jgi:hypothetical protein
VTAQPVVLPRAIERGVLGLRSVAACVLDGSPTFHAETRKWVVTLTVHRSGGSRFIDATTRWCALIDACYPFGDLAIHPASDGGIAATFPHQSRNTSSSPPRAWRNGKLCLDTPLGNERLIAPVSDPVGDADARLRWHVERAQLWLHRAADDQLLAAGDPFELPAKPSVTSTGRWERQRIVHDESSISFEAWRGCSASYGTTSFGADPDIANAILMDRFLDRNGESIRAWSGRARRNLDDVAGFWWLWPKPILLEPWEAPATWGELRRVAKAQGLDSDAVLRCILPSVRGSTTDNVLLLGYPIPMHIGEPVTEVHWDAILLPPVPAATGKPPHGFRANAAGWWHRDRRDTFVDTLSLKYLPTENWGIERLQARGRLPAHARSLRVVMLGVGALGSHIAEMLARAGVSELALVDDDLIQAGNVCRHSATLADVGKRKVRAVAQKLRQISPTVRVTEVLEALGGSPSEVMERLDEYDAIIDCTASDEVLMLLASAWWPIPRLFASFSMGYGAKRLFSFGANGHTFPHDDFVRSIRPWLEHETRTWAASTEVFEGAGCWSPLFPARCDDVALAAAVCIKQLEALVAGPPPESRLRVFAQSMSDEGFAGFAPEKSLPGLEAVALR